MKKEMQERVNNRPLLLERSKCILFNLLADHKYHKNLAQIRAMQKFADILKESGVKPEDHLDEEAKQLLKDGEYLDRRLNQK